MDPQYQPLVSQTHPVIDSVEQRLDELALLATLAGITVVFVSEIDLEAIPYGGTD